jgi:thymidylate synthase
MTHPYIGGEILDDVLREVIQEVRRRGVPIKPSKGPALELSGMLLEVTNPRARLSRTETRGKVFSALGELSWYLAGTNKVGFVSYYIKPCLKMADGDEIHGG